MTKFLFRPLAAVLCVAAATLANQAAGQPATPAQPGPAAPASPAAGWHTLKGPDSSFTAEFPAEPVYKSVLLKTAAGAGYTMHQFQLEKEGAAYVAQTAVYPEDVRTTNPRASLQGGLDASAKNMDGEKWASMDWVKHEGGLTGVEAIGARGGLAIRTYSVMKGRQIFTLTFAGPAGSARSDDANRFIASLRVSQ
jgi:hypothetical protein